MKHQSVSMDGSKSESFSRQSSTKWIPTNEQARILRDLYHNYGVRSPNLEQIQKISNRLRQYGKIEGKNVFYWFSNYKARERRKRRLSVDFPSSNTTTPPGACGPDATCSSLGPHAVGRMRSSECTGSVLMEKSYKCCFMSGGGEEPVLERNKGWVMGLESPTITHDARVQEANTSRAEIRTLPLFPIHAREEEKVEQEKHQQGKQTEECGVRSFVSGVPQQPKPSGRIPAFLLDGGHQQQEDHGSLELTLDSSHHVPLRST